MLVDASPFPFLWFFCFFLFFLGLNDSHMYLFMWSIIYAAK